MKRILVLALCALMTAGCAGSDRSAEPATTSQLTMTQTTPQISTEAPETDTTTTPRSYREVLARLPPFDEPASPEVAAWRKATISAMFARCAAGGGAIKASFVAANRRILDEIALYPGAVLVSERSIGQGGGRGCPSGSGPATYYTTYRTYRLPAGTKPAAVLTHYEHELYGWLETAPTPCERTYGQGPGYVVVSACKGVLRVSMRARGPVELPEPVRAPPRPFGVKYPFASKSSTTPKPTAYESVPGKTCERVAGAEVPSIIIPPSPGLTAEIRGRQLVVDWTLGTVHGDCPPSALALSASGATGATVVEPVHAASGVTRMQLLDNAPRPKQLTARAISVDGAQSRAVAVLVRDPR